MVQGVWVRRESKSKSGDVCARIVCSGVVEREVKKRGWRVQVQSGFKIRVQGRGSSEGG